MPMDLPVPDDALYAPMSFAQRSLWLADQLDPGQPTYHVLAALRVSGELDEDALEWALNQVIDRHEALRTVFRLVDGEPTQVVLPALPVRLTVQWAEPDQVAELVQAEVAISFHLERGPLLRLRLFRTAEQAAVLVLVMHHLISDGWSSAVLFGELTELYGARRSGQPAELPELPIQYLDFAAWQQEQLTDDRLAELREYWTARLTGLAALRLPGDQSGTIRQTSRGTTLRFDLPAELTERVEALARHHQASAFMVLLAALDVLLARYSGESDIAVSSLVAGRDRAEVKGLIGYFVNTLILRTDTSGDPSFTELLGRVRTSCLEAYEHQELPFDEVVGLVAGRRRIGGQPLSRVMLAWQNLPQVGWQAAGLHLQPMEIDTGTAKDDLTLTFEPTEDGYSGLLEYSDDLFDPAAAEQLVGHFGSLLAAAIAAPDRPISRLPLLSATERGQQLTEVNAGYRQRGRPWVHELIERQAAASPAAVAVLCGEQRLSYAELDQQANALAVRLVEGGLGLEDVVGVLLPRSCELVVTLLAVLKAGGAYLLLDADYPDARLREILADARAAVLVSRLGLADRVAGAAARPVLLDDPLPLAARGPELSLPGQARCYLNYTSGSTGRPKGVMNVHAGMVNFCAAVIESYRLTAADRFAQLAAVSFDVLVEEVFPVLMVGGAVVLPDGPMPWSADELWSLVRQHQVSVLDVPTSRLLSWSPADRAAAPEHLRMIITGGDAVPPAVLDGWSSWPGELVNSYGVTEASCSSTLHPIGRPADRPASTGSSLPIGRPYPSCQAYLLDQWLEPVPPGLTGELYLGGVTVGRGYVGQPALTAERFLPDPFGSPGDRLYRTGDLARRLPSGELVFISRVDQQVKIRGFRVEPGEVESVLNQHPELAGCAVTSQPDATGSYRLVAFVVPRRPAEPPAVADLRDYLEQRLPRHLVPSVFVVLDRLPTLPNGKLDRAALAVTSDQAEPATEYLAPRTPLEELVAEQWAALLGVSRVGVLDEFFELGGHSLIAIRFASWARSELGVELPMQALFGDQPTVASVAELLYELLSADEPTLDPAQAAGR